MEKIRFNFKIGDKVRIIDTDIIFVINLRVYKEYEDSEYFSYAGKSVDGDESANQKELELVGD